MKHCLFAIAGVIAVLASCFSPYKGNETTGLPGDGTKIISSDLFNPFDSYPNTIRFYTNDPKYQTPSGFTLWTFSSDPAVFQERTAELWKTAGSRIAGYGLIIGASEQPVGGFTENVFLTVMIRDNGQYAVGKVIGAAYIPVVNWKTNAGLLPYNTGIANKIKIVQKPGNQYSYDLYFNDIPSDPFTDEIEPRCEGNVQNGYIVVIAPDDLISSAVEVFFRE